MKSRNATAAKKNELKYYGVQACLSLFEKNPSRIVRTYILKDQLHRFSSLLKWSASNKKAYHLVTTEDMKKIAGSVHHEGVVILAKAPRIADDSQLIHDVLKDNEMGNAFPIVVLDNLQNPHNIGSLIRTCCHFGVRRVAFLSKDKGNRLITSALTRVAQGALDHVKLYEVSETTKTLGYLKRKEYRLYATSSHSASSSLFEIKFDPKSILVLGNEVNGVNKDLLKFANKSIYIPGSGNIESLNVSIACGSILTEVSRQLCTK